MGETSVYSIVLTNDNWVMSQWATPYRFSLVRVARKRLVNTTRDWEPIPERHIIWGILLQRRVIWSRIAWSRIAWNCVVLCGMWRMDVCSVICRSVYYVIVRCECMLIYMWVWVIINKLNMARWKYDHGHRSPHRITGPNSF